MTTHLPSKERLLDACAGSVASPHPVLQAAYELASLHEAGNATDSAELSGIDCARARLIHDIDCWAARELPRPYAAAALHTETLGMVVDRIARFSVAARLLPPVPDREPRPHPWTRLAGLALAYTDLSHDLSARTRRLPESALAYAEDIPRQQI